MKGLFAGALLALIPGVALATDPPPLSVTIYNENLALVEQTRSLNVTQGVQRVEFADVSAQIRPETVALSAPGITIVEQNFDYDLLTPAALMARGVGQQVQIVRTNPGSGAQTTETATILSVNNGVVLQIGERIEVLRDDGVPTRVIFPRVPPNLRASPTLSVTLQADRAGARQARLSYLTTGFSWRADYVAVFDDQANRLNLQGWITLSNTSGTTFTNASAQLVAGDINVTRSGPEYWQREYQRRQMRENPQAYGRAGTQGSAAGGADYYIYPLTQPVTIANNQTKQVGFLEASGVASTRIYRFQAPGLASNATPQPADVAIQFRNAASGGLGAPLPAGIFRVYIRARTGDPTFVGESYLGHTPQGSDVEVTIGRAFDVTVQGSRLTYERRDNHIRSGMSYRFRNARAAPATVLFEQVIPEGSSVEAPNLRGESVDAGRYRWSVDVPANGETELRFTVDQPVP